VNIANSQGKRYNLLIAQFHELQLCWYCFSSVNSFISNQVIWLLDKSIFTV
jgi:hypothetical protein